MNWCVEPEPQVAREAFCVRIDVPPPSIQATSLATLYFSGGLRGPVCINDFDKTDFGNDRGAPADFSLISSATILTCARRPVRTTSGALILIDEDREGVIVSTCHVGNGRLSRRIEWKVSGESDISFIVTNS